MYIPSSFHAGIPIHPDLPDVGRLNENLVSFVSDCSSKVLSIVFVPLLVTATVPDISTPFVKLGLASGAAPDTSDTEIVPSANSLPSEIKSASVRAFDI